MHNIPLMRDVSSLDVSSGIAVQKVLAFLQEEATETSSANAAENLKEAVDALIAAKFCGTEPKHIPLVSVISNKEEAELYAFRVPVINPEHAEPIPVAKLAAMASQISDASSKAICSISRQIQLQEMFSNNVGGVSTLKPVGS